MRQKTTARLLPARLQNALLPGKANV